MSGDCFNSIPICEELDPRPEECKGALFIPVSNAEKPEWYDLLSPAGLEDIEYGVDDPQRHLGHVADEPWICNKWNAEGEIEYNVCGFELAEDGSLGDCVPEGWAGFSCGWRPPCPAGT